MKSPRRARTHCLVLAAALQAFGAFSPALFLLTVPIGFVLVLAAVVCQGLVNEAIVPPRSRLANAGATLRTFVAGGAGYAGAILGASAVAEALSRHAK